MKLFIMQWSYDGGIVEYSKTNMSMEDGESME